MAWNLVKFNKLYYRVNGGTEYEWTENNNLLLPPLLGNAQSELNSYGAQYHSYGYTAYKNSNPDVFNLIGNYNGGRGLDFNYYWRTMSNGQRIEIYRESGNNNIALVLEKNSGAAGFRVGTKYYSTYSYFTDCQFTITSVDSSGNTYPGTINKTTSNIGIITNGTKYSLCCADLYGIQFSGYNDRNGYELKTPKYYDNVSIILTILLYNNTPLPPSSDPYDPGGTSTTDPQGTGNFDDSSDAISAPAMTSLSPIDADFIKLYKIDKPNLTAFAQYLFSTSFTTNLEKMWNSVSEAILCLNLLPFTPAGTASTATDIIFDSSDSNADGYLITQQYEELDFGSVTISEFYGSCLDYTPYTQIQLSLPYAQTVNLDPDEFMGRSVGVKCRVDVYTGSALYLIDNGTSVLMQVPATLANPLPWSAKDYSAVISSIANLAITVGGGLAVLATGGASTPVAIAIAGGVAANTASNVMQAKPHYQHGGSAGMGTGMFGIQKPYLIIKRPRQCLPVDNNKYQGYPSMATLLLGNLTGFTKVLQIHLDNLPATDAEKKELETILKGGVWF